MAERGTRREKVEWGAREGREKEGGRKVVERRREGGRVKEGGGKTEGRR